MKTILSVLLLGLFGALSPTAWADAPSTGAASLDAFLTRPIKSTEVGFYCLGRYADVVVRVGDKTVVFDPARMFDEGEVAALNRHGVDALIYTHPHSDHFSRATLMALYLGSQPAIVADPMVATLISGDVPAEKLIAADPGKPIIIGDIRVDALVGAHIGPITVFRVIIDGVRIFHGGDSAFVPMQQMASDIAFVPTGSPSPTCKPAYAVKMMKDLKAQVAVPIHGWSDEHGNFKAQMKVALPTIRVVVTEPGIGHTVTINR